MFSLSLKFKTATVALREGYKLTWKILYRNKGVNMIPLEFFFF